MFRILSLLSVLLTLVACGSREPAPTLILLHQVIEDNASGITFEIPATWVETTTAQARVFSPHKSTSEWYHTLTLQPIGLNTDQAADKLLREAYKSLQDEQPATIVRLESLFVDSVLCLFYDLRFKLVDTNMRRTGLLLPHNTLTFEFAYTAPEERFSNHLLTFEHTLNSISIDSPYPSIRHTGVGTP